MAVHAQSHFALYGSQDWIDNANACGAAINQLFASHSQPQQCNSILFDSNSAPKVANHSSLPQLPSMAVYADKQKHEVDRYIGLQNERLRLLIQEQRQQQIALLMKKIESKALPLFRIKDEEIAQAANRTMEFQDFLRRLEVENQAWQRAAQENEAMVLSLNYTIEQTREKAAATCCFDNGAEDAESCCDVMMNREEETELQQRNRVVSTVDDSKFNLTQERKKMMICKGCNSRNSCTFVHAKLVKLFLILALFV